MNLIKHNEQGIVIGLVVFLAAAIMMCTAPVALAETAMDGPQTQQATQTENYLDAIPDLPLMVGVTEIPDQGVLFDTPGGRLIEAFARGAVGADSVVKFYRLSLPQLGWREDTGSNSKGDQKNLVFRRDGEILRIEVTPPRKRSTGEPYVEIRFSLMPG